MFQDGGNSSSNMAPDDVDVMTTMSTSVSSRDEGGEGGHFTAEMIALDMCRQQSSLDWNESSRRYPVTITPIPTSEIALKVRRQSGTLTVTEDGVLELQDIVWLSDSSSCRPETVLQGVHTQTPVVANESRTRLSKGYGWG